MIKKKIFTFTKISTLNKDLQECYGFVFEKALLKEIAEIAVSKYVKANETIIDIGGYINYIPLLINGAIKILREDTEGEELALFYIERGDTCPMTMSCYSNDSKSKIKAVAETDVKLLLIPKQKMSGWLSKYKSWQNYILQSYHSRLEEFIEAIDALAFLNMDQRLLKYLKDKAYVNNNDIINVTHQQIAKDLHTSRVVISRLLKNLENQFKIKLNRNQIKVLDL